jgi:hypothetical protein
VTRRDQRVLVTLALISSLGMLAEAVGLLAPALLYAAPLLILALPLIAGRYVGEEHIARFAVARRRPRRRPIARVAFPAAARRDVLAVPRGGRLIAASLAVRPPPAAALAR